MKKTFFILVASVFTAGTITFVACGKDKTDTETQQVATKNAEDLKIVGYSNPGSMEIIPLVDKDAFLEQLEQYLNSEEAGRYVSEDLKMWNEPYGDGKYAPLMSVSFFDLKEDFGSTIFIKMESVDENDKVYYAVGDSSPTVNCEGKCDAPCRPDPIEMTCTCPDKKPANLTFEQECQWAANHYCKVKEPSLGDSFLVALIKKFLDWLF